MSDDQSVVRSQGSPKCKWARLMMCTLGYLLSLLSMSGCGGVDHQALSARCKLLKSHPRRSYLVTRAEGKTLREARRRASAELSRQLSAEVRSEVSVKGVGQRGDSTEQVTEHIEISTHFKHAELIKPLSRCEVCRGARCITAVALNRDQAAKRLMRDLGSDVQTLSVTTQDVNMTSPLLRFTQAWYQANAAYQRMRPLLNQLRVLGRMSRALARSDQMMKRASQEVARRHERLWIAIAPLQLKGDLSMPQGLAEAVDGQFSRALESLKLKRWGQAECPRETSRHQDQTSNDVMRVIPQGRVHCTLGLIGPQCRLALGIKVELCPHEQLTQIEWSDLKLVSVHPRDPKRALSKLNQSLIRADLSGVLKQTLSPFIIF